MNRKPDRNPRYITNLKRALPPVLLAALLGLLPVVGGHSTVQAFLQASETPLPSPTPTDPPTATSTPLPSATPTDPAPTLVPPTPIPQQATPQAAAAITESALARVQADRVLRVGTYYNAYPFTWLNELGEVVGYEADIVRSISVELGVDVEFVQVTRHNAIQTLQSGEIDLLIGQQVLSQDRESLLDYTHPYYLNYEYMVVVEESAYSDLAQLAGQPVGVEIGSRSEHALNAWIDRSGITLDVRTYFTESDALDALANGEVQGTIGVLDSLRRAGRLHMRLIDQPLLEEPYAIVVRRWDINLRNLLNRSLQRLGASGRLDEIFAEWFPGETLDFHTLVPVYDTLYEDERTLDEFNTDLPLPDRPVLDRIDENKPVRVAGLAENDTAPAQLRITNALNQALIEEMARRWNARVNFVPDSALNAVNLVANGQAEIAIGITPRWDGADRVDYSLPYAEHGDRLMVPEKETITGFSDMLGTGWWIGYFADDATDAEHIQKYADIFNVGQNISIFALQGDDRAIYTMTVENNITAIFGDSLRLLALQRDAGDSLPAVKILDTWYGTVVPVAFAVPRNDADFRALVDHTLQVMAQDGTYQRIWAETLGFGDPLAIPVWPASNPDGPLE
ncbi:MAG: transporter substrate-binding domain-containing protein [Anaerolineae bacterium]|nr:transporter substrate-binding domain-containing protein [Anaerolineae bacterium]